MTGAMINNAPQEQQKQPFAAQQYGGKRKHQVKGFLHGQGPQDVPAARQVAVVPLKPVHMKSQSGQQGAAEGRALGMNDEIRAPARSAQSGREEGEAGRARYARTHAVKAADIDRAQVAPAAQ